LTKFEFLVDAATLAETMQPATFGNTNCLHRPTVTCRCSDELSTSAWQWMKGKRKSTSYLADVMLGRFMGYGYNVERYKASIVTSL